MKVIDYEMIRELELDTNTMYDWAMDVLLNKDDYQLPPKISMKKEGHVFVNVMPSIMDPIGVAGIKIVNRFPDRVPSLDSQIMLYDSNSGETLALMDGNYITAYRTGAVANIAIDQLAISNYETMSFIGLGNVAYATMKILANKLDRHLTIKLYKYKDQAENFINYFKDYDLLDFEIVNNYEDLIRNTDVIVSCVTSTDINFGKDEWFKEGCLVVPVHTLGFQNCDLFFDKAIVDDVGHVCNFKYYDKLKKVYELTNVLKGEKPGRLDSKERIIAYNIGNSIFDIYYAKRIFDLIKEKDNEITIDLKSPKLKMWI